MAKQRKETKPTVPDYNALLKELRAWHKKTTGTGTQALNRERLDAYWHIGQKLKRFVTGTKTLLTKLADDLDVSYPLLQRTRQFYEIWPKGISGPASELSWSHHVFLLPIERADIRNFYIEQAIKQGWGANRLKKAIAKNYFEEFDQTIFLSRDPAVNGVFHHYKAVPEKIIDGDTIDAKVDAGFHVWISLRLRLRGINCAEMKDGGEAAKAFVEQALKNCAFIAIHTRKTDIYGRYLADVYYHEQLTDKEEIVQKGFHLNQQLLDLRLAKPMMV